MAEIDPGVQSEKRFLPAVKFRPSVFLKNADIASRLAATSADRIFATESDLSTPSETLVVIFELMRDIDKHGLSYEEADHTFRRVLGLLQPRFEIPDSRVWADFPIKNAGDILRSEAISYFIKRIVHDTKDQHVGDILVEIERLLLDVEAELISPLYREALERVKNECEKKIERQRRRTTIKGAMQDAEASQEKLVSNKFTRKQAMALLDAFLNNEFHSADNVVKAAFLTKLTPYDGEKKIAQEYSYLRISEHDELIEYWRDKFLRRVRGRKKKTT